MFCSTKVKPNSTTDTDMFQQYWSNSTTDTDIFPPGYIILVPTQTSSICEMHSVEITLNHGAYPISITSRE